MLLFKDTKKHNKVSVSQQQQLLQLQQQNISNTTANLIEEDQLLELAMSLNIDQSLIFRFDIKDQLGFEVIKYTAH